MSAAREIEQTAAEARQFLTDVRLAGVLVNEMRYQALEFVGVRRDDANVATVVIAAVAADAAHRRLSRLMRLAKPPSRGDVVLAGGVATELLHELGGPSSRDIPYYGVMIVVSVGATRAGPVVRQAIDGVAGVSRQAIDALRRNYDYMVGRARSVAESTLADTRLADTRLGEVVLGDSKTDDTSETRTTPENGKTSESNLAQSLRLRVRAGLRRGRPRFARGPDQGADDPHDREDDPDHEQDVVALPQRRDTEEHERDEVRDREDDPQKR
jgi:hypothetical protein